MLYNNVFVSFFLLLFTCHLSRNVGIAEDGGKAITYCSLTFLAASDYWYNRQAIIEGASALSKIKPSGIGSKLMTLTMY